MKHKVVIVDSQSDTDMTIGGTVYFDTEQQARDYVVSHNVANRSRAYSVHVSNAYTMTEGTPKSGVA